VAALTFGILASPATGAVQVRFERIQGFDAKSTPARYDKVGVLEVGPRRAPNILILNPGTSASAAYFAPLARTVVKKTKGWQVWAVERRENLLEDHSVLNRAKRGRGVVMGGHSLGGTITTAYATWDFGGRPGARDLAGLVYIDGGSSPAPMTPDDARRRLGALDTSSPWLAFGGITAPFAGIFNSTGSTSVLIDPDTPSLGQTFPLLPANLKPPVRVTNVGQYGYALDTETSPPGLAAAQAHLGRLAASGEPRGWSRGGELTPIRRYARMFAGWGLRGLDGTAWYHPLRLTIDSGAVAAGNANPAQAILEVRATHGDDLPKRMPIYAFGAALGGERVLEAARILARQSGIPKRRLTLIDRSRNYSHNDPNSAAPRNAFVANLVPFLERISRAR
jgi:hypothetical protein